MIGLTRALAEFALERPVAELPAGLRDRMLRRIGSLACLAVAGAEGGEAARLRALLAPFTNTEEVGVLGCQERFGLCEAPMLTAAAISAAWRAVVDRGLVDQESWPDGPVLAAALAAAEQTSASGREVVDAVVVGAEVGLRVEAALSPALTAGGWAGGVVASRLGAAAAAGRILRLDTRRMVNALGLAATQVAGLASTRSVPVGVVSAAKTAGDGVEAAVLARSGFDGPAAPLEGRRGLAQVLAPGHGPLDQVAAGLGVHWLIGALPDHGDRYPTGSAPVFAVAIELDGHDGVADLLEAGRGSRVR